MSSYFERFLDRYRVEVTCVAAKEAIAYVELVIHCPSLILAIFANYRHGFMRQLGWFYLGTSCAIRLASAAMEIYKRPKPPKHDEFHLASDFVRCGA